VLLSMYGQASNIRRVLERCRRRCKHVLIKDVDGAFNLNSARRGREKNMRILKDRKKN
jgi:hypothetical protein